MAKQPSNPISDAIQKNLRKKVGKEYGKIPGNKDAIINAMSPNQNETESVAEIFNLNTNQSSQSETKNPKGTKAVKVWGPNTKNR